MIARGAAALAAAIALHAAAGTPVAFVADVQGSATIEGDGRLAFLTQLEPGMRLFLGTGARAAITFARSGSEYTAAGPGEFLVAESDLRAERGAGPMRRDVTPLADTAIIGRIARSATASLRMRSAAPAKSAATDSGPLAYPVGTRVATLEPVLRWQPPAGTRDATMVLRDESGKRIWSGKAAAAVKPPVKLSAATRYRWTVMTPRGALGEAEFETLAADSLAKVEGSKASAGTFPARVLHAVLLQDLGADQDARAAWAELARERPDLPELAALAR